MTNRMKKIFTLLFFLVSTLIVSQEETTTTSSNKFTISGYVKDGGDGEAIIGAVVYKQGTQISTTTNEYGFYSLTLPAGKHTLVVTYLGYTTIVQEIDLTKNTTLNFEPKEQGRDLQEVEVSAEAADKNIKSTEMSATKIDIKQIQKMPALLGEVDVIKAIQLLPGVTTVGEGASGFNVRGGNIDQNLVLLDEAPVYNSSHLFGFFSVFNPDAVKDVKLIKGGIPSQYGGRVSSILDIRMKEGNSKTYEVNGGIGTIFSRLAIEAPIVKDKVSFIVAGRRSYIDILAKPELKKKQPDLANAKFYFYDLTAKLNWKINPKNTVYVSGYFGKDVFGAGFTFNWGNATTSLRWNRVINNKLFMNLTAFYSNYDYELGFKNDGTSQKFEWKSNIINYSIKPDFTYYMNGKSTIRFGLQSILYDFKPGTAKVTDDNNNTINIGLQDKRGVEYAAYVGNEYKLLPRLTVDYGLRWSAFTYIAKTIYNYRDTIPNTEKPLDSEKKNDNWQFSKTYNNAEPRFSLNYVIDDKSSIKASYNRMAQYIQIVSNTAASTPLDVYTSATNNIKPLVADQGALGYFRNFRDNMFETSLEVYYKYMQNQLDYIDNADLLLNKYLEAQLLQGLGRAYGAELYVRKTKGKLTGWVSYTLSKTERLVRGISNDKWFYSKYDRTHMVNTVVTYDLNKRLTFSGNFIFLSGTPATFPNAKLQIQTINVPYNTTNTRNNYRITPYNRLDLSVTFHLTRNPDAKKHHALVLSVYNVYNRRNAFSIYFRTKEGDPAQTEAVRYSVIGTIVPALTYNFRF
jgi:hypothetical protein